MDRERERHIRLLEEKVSILEQQLLEARKVESEVRRRADIQSALNAILRVSLLPVSLNEQLNRVLEIILEIPWLSLQKKGCVLLTRDCDHELRMAASRNLDSTTHKTCSLASVGHCFCRQALANQEIVFTECVDSRHDNRFPGMKPHGYYCAPLIFHGKTLGVLTLYVEEGHEPDPIEPQFLSSVAQVLAGMIDRKQMEQRLEQMSFEDALTGLPNRRYLVERLQQAIHRARRTQKKIAVLFLDLDCFKPVNDNFGHEVGDTLLKAVGGRLLPSLRSTDMLARLGGDEFVALLEMIEDVLEAEDIARRISKAMTKPFLIMGREIRIGVSVGVGLYPRDGDKPHTLVKSADQAMYRANQLRKQQNANGFQS